MFENTKPANICFMIAFGFLVATGLFFATGSPALMLFPVMMAIASTLCGFAIVVAKHLGLMNDEEDNIKE